MIKCKINTYFCDWHTDENYLRIDINNSEKFITVLDENAEIFNKLEKSALYIYAHSLSYLDFKEIDGIVEYYHNDGSGNLDFRKLGNYKNLVYLDLNVDSILDADQLLSIHTAKLRYLSLNFKKISGLKGGLQSILQYFDKLIYLYIQLSQEKIEVNLNYDFNNLKMLHLHAVHKKSKINFSELKNLEYLNLFCETVLQYDLHTLKSLRGLELYNCLKDENIDYISEMENLEAISIGSFRSLKRLPDFSKLKKLKSISLYNCNQLEDYTPLLNCPSLEYIGIDGVPKDYDISKTFCLSALPNLKKFGSFGNRGYYLKPHLPEAQKLNEIFHGKYSPAFEHFYYYYLAEKPEDSYMQDFGNNNEPVE